MESRLTRLDDIDGEVSIITNQPTSKPTAYKVNCENAANNKNVSKHNGTKPSTTEDEIFHWLDEFSSVMCSVAGNTNYELLEYLLTSYQKNISRVFYSCCFLKPFRFVKLKNHIKNTLIFFYFCWRNVKERISDDYTYLDKMTEIVRMYLDLEVLSSSKDNDSFDNLSANILHAIHIYLDNSEEHVFKVLLKSKCVTKTFSRIYSPIFQKYFSNLKSNAETLSNFAYVRYLLAFKLWKKIVSSREEKTKITDMALIKLGSLVPKMDPELSQFIPEPPAGEQSGTLWLMQSNILDFRKICDGFLTLEAKMHSSSFSTEFEELNLKGSNAFLQLDLDDGFKQKADTKLVQTRKNKPVPKRVFPKLKPGEVLSIDLTIDNEVEEEININKRKIKEKQQWLKEAKVHRKFKKPQPFPKRTKLVQLADAHSTESCENLEKTRSENASISSKTVYGLDKYSVCSPVEENIVSSQTAENKANALRDQKTSAVASLKNMCQKCCDITSNSATQKSNTNKNSADFVHSSTTYVTSVCDKLRTSVLHNKSRDIFNYTTEGISSRSGKLLPTDWDNRFDRTEICAVSTTVGDHASESSSGAWTDYNSADSEAPDAIASPTSEIFINSCKIQCEEVGEETELGGFSTTASDPLTPEKTIDVCLSETVARTTPTKLDIWSAEMNTLGFHKFSEDLASYLDQQIPSDSLLEGSLGPTGILNSLLDFDLIGRVDSSQTDFVYSNVQAIDPNLLRKDPEEFDFKISNLFSDDSPPSFESEEGMEMMNESEKSGDSPEMVESEMKVREELSEAIETPDGREEQIKEEVSSTSRKILEARVYNTRHKRKSAVWRNLMETKDPKRRKRSRRFSSLSSDTEDILRREKRVQLPFKKRCCHTYQREIIEKKNVGVIKKGV
ncbi:uncharacterized protein LOC117177191 [Belonocnema kinseyi]|uniref:uncharacterized protein LOC117177191 n=1 Tax=Belonocnema kinseyi TaxID=2817044 RepID=UPI00143D30FB|nr:uncharacterized protein LOC117177191 [Belonocnema kinseyi]